MNKWTVGILGAIILYGASMYDGRWIYDPEELIDCKVGQYTFTLMRKDCY